jgi:hypothetical protein
MDILGVERSPKMPVFLARASLVLVSHPRTKLSALETALRRISQVGGEGIPRSGATDGSGTATCQGTTG